MNSNFTYQGIDITPEEQTKYMDTSLPLENQYYNFVQALIDAPHVALFMLMTAHNAAKFFCGLPVQNSPTKQIVQIPLHEVSAIYKYYAQSRQHQTFDKKIAQVMLMLNKELATEVVDLTEASNNNNNHNNSSYSTTSNYTQPSLTLFSADQMYTHIIDENISNLVLTLTDYINTEIINLRKSSNPDGSRNIILNDTAKNTWLRLLELGFAFPNCLVRENKNQLKITSLEDYLQWKKQFLGHRQDFQPF